MEEETYRLLPIGRRCGQLLGQRRRGQQLTQSALALHRIRKAGSSSMAPKMQVEYEEDENTTTKHMR